jgi:TolB-like protein/tRNA A-37 threonylcarbamoyl transferase component Bud32
VIGRTLSRYRILERLGEGGMGEVYLAEDLRLHRPVALKVLRAQELCEEEARNRLLAEARLASALNHPNIAVVYEVDEVEGGEGGAPVFFLVLEYVAGEPIDAYVARVAPDPDALIDLVAQVADALAEAHARGIVHRDVKPSNLLVTAAGRVKVLDFGLARLAAPAATDATTWSRAPEGEGGAAVGTLGYMAPEQAAGQTVDGRADVFSLGVVLYQLLAGRRPFEGANAWEVAGAILHREPPPLAETEPRRAALAELARRMLAKSPAARPADLRAVGAELAAIRARRLRPAAGAPRAGVVVLDFETLSGGAEDDWLAAGVVETVRTDLARVEGLAVVARDRVEEALRRLAGEAAAAGADLAPRIGRLLDARWVVGGALQRAGEGLRVTLRLTDAASGATREGPRLDGRVDALFELQDRVVRALAEQLAEAPAASERAETAVLAAYEALAKGLLNLRTETYEGLDRAQLFFERAVALDPSYARAYVELAVARAQQADYLAWPELHERALAGLETAIRLRPGWARAHRELGATLVALGRIDEGLAALGRALELAPDDPTVLAGHARALFTGRADFAGAARGFERALEGNPHAGWYWLQLAHCRTLARDLVGARAAAARAAELQEKLLSGRESGQIVGAYMRIGHVAALEGRPEEAAQRFQQEAAFLAGVDHALRGRIAIELHLRLGAARLALGLAEEAAASFATALDAWERRLALGADEPFTRYYAAAVRALTGDVERAFADLERAAELRPRYTMARALIEPEFAALRATERFRALVARALPGR